MMAEPRGTFRSDLALRRHAAKLKEHGLDRVIVAMPRRPFIMSDLPCSPGRRTLRLKEDGIITKVQNRNGLGTVWKRGPNWKRFAAVFSEGD